MTNQTPKTHSELLGAYLYALVHGSPEELQELENQLNSLPCDPALADLPPELLEESIGNDASLLEILLSAAATPPAPTPSPSPVSDDFDLTDRAITRDERWYSDYLARQRREQELEHEQQHDQNYDR